MKAKHLIYGAGRSIKKHSPVILSSVAVAGVVVTSIFTAKGTPVSNRLIEQAKEKKGGELTKWELIKAGYKPYLPAAVSGTVTIASIVSSTAIGQRRVNNLAAAYILLDQSYRKHKHRIKEFLGPEKFKEFESKFISEAVNESKFKNGKATENKMVCYFEGFGIAAEGDRFIECSEEDFRSAELEINRELIENGYVALESVLKYFGLIDGKDEVEDAGWSFDTVLEYKSSSWLNFTRETFITDDGMEVERIAPEVPFSIYYLDNFTGVAF